MACAITAIDQSSGSCAPIGGVVHSYVTECDNITSATVDATGQITAFVMSGSSQWIKFIYDDDDTAFYNEEPDRQGKRIFYNQSASMKFEEVTNAKIHSARELAQCCCTVWIHRMTSGVARVQGLDVDPDNTDYSLSKDNAKVSPGVFSDTGANADRVEWTVGSVGRVPSGTTTLTDAAIEAL